MTDQPSLTAKPPRIDLHGAFVRRVRMPRTNFMNANLAGADATGADFRGADFEGANLEGTILIGADLREAVNLTEDQLNKAVLDRSTQLPAYIDRGRLRIEVPGEVATP